MPRVNWNELALNELNKVALLFKFKNHLQACIITSEKKLLIVYAKQPTGNHRGQTRDANSRWVKGWLYCGFIIIPASSVIWWPLLKHAMKDIEDTPFFLWSSFAFSKFEYNIAYNLHIYADLSTISRKAHTLEKKCLEISLICGLPASEKRPWISRREKRKWLQVPPMMSTLMSNST